MTHRFGLRFFSPLLAAAVLTLLALSCGCSHGADTEPASIAEYIPLMDPHRQLGDIVEMLSDGKTYLLTAGSSQGLHQGMRLDVHRPDGDRYRYVGQIEIVNILADEFSMATALAFEPVPFCPLTGRAVRSGGESSPFVARRDGAPVALERVETPAVEDGVPAVGDMVDAPL